MSRVLIRVEECYRRGVTTEPLPVGDLIAGFAQFPCFARIKCAAPNGHIRHKLPLWSQGSWDSQEKIVNKTS
jgi:hypothetical protein